MKQARKIFSSSATLVFVGWFLGVLSVNGQSYYQPSPGPDDLARPVAEQGRRPSFLPAPAPEQPALEQFTGDNAPKRTFMTQVELPLPEPVSESLQPEIVENNQVPASTDPNLPIPPAPRGNSPTIVFEDEEGQKKIVPVLPQPPPPPPDPGILLREKRYAQLVPMLLESKDSVLAAALGWSYYNDKNYIDAGRWFQQAVLWNETNYEATYGIALVLLRQNKLNEAEEAARWRLVEYPKMQSILGDITTARAVAAYQSKNYVRSRELFDEVERFRPLTRDEKILKAWSDFNCGLEAQAADAFERLYLDKPDKAAAAGVYAAYAKQKNWKRLATFSEEHGGALATLYRDHMAERYYSKGLYANAEKLAPGRYPELKGYTSPVVEGGATYRHKTGASGQSKLDEVRAELGGVLWQYDVHQLGAQIGMTDLDAGSLGKRALVGKSPLEPKDRDYNHTPQTSYGSLFDFNFFYQHEGLQTLRVDVGSTPSGGAVSPTIVGGISLRGVTEWGDWKIEAFRESIKQSILSYTGWEDPYSGKTWGRVTESGLRLSSFVNLQDDWSIFGQFTAGTLQGDSVESNNHVRVNLSLKKSIKNPDFAYITLGPSFTFETYDRNLSMFTYGHGGYFSPNYLIQGTLGLQFMTLEGRSWLIKGGLEVGLQNYEEGVSSIFPLDDSVSIYQGQKASTIIALAEVSALFQLSPHWAFGSTLSYNRTADYSEFYAGMYFKYFFNSRTGLFAQDLFRF